MLWGEAKPHYPAWCSWDDGWVMTVVRKPWHEIDFKWTDEWSNQRAIQSDLSRWELHAASHANIDQVGYQSRSSAKPLELWPSSAAFRTQLSSIFHTSAECPWNGFLIFSIAVICLYVSFISISMFKFWPSILQLFLWSFPRQCLSTFGDCLEILLVVTTAGSRVIQIPKGQRPGLLLQILPCTEQPPTTKTYLAPDIVPRLGNPHLEILNLLSNFCFRKKKVPDHHCLRPGLHHFISRLFQ